MRFQRPAVQLSLATFMLASVACGQQDTLWQRSASCAITVCLNGAGGDRHPGNQVVAELCRQLPGLIENCSGDDVARNDAAGGSSVATCSPTFSSTGGARATDAVMDAIDLVRGQRCPVSIVGYSLGGMNAAVMAGGLADRDVSVDRLVLFDPFSPLGPDPVPISPAVVNAWVYRHSVAPADDCSANRPIIGPYEGFAPDCERGTRCVDYDFSRDERFVDVDHCTVPVAGFDAATTNVLTGEDAPNALLPEGVVTEP